ncbi:MAG: hypothetical protein FWD60_00835 [Candidatus Azobacteroides sp.]|nr:hypothetical protein [Candidatus Azobacteroides sp.]
MNKIFLLMLLLFCINVYGQLDFSGDWYWTENDDDNTFNITLTKVNDSFYKGTHCGVFAGGMKMDCVDGDEPSLSATLQGDSLIVTFTSQFCLKKGKAVIKFSNDSIIWKIIKEPDGEYYLPDEAILRK